MSNRGKRLQSEMGAFLKQYARKAQRGVEPNDRRYDRDMENKIKSMAPEDISKLMQGEFYTEVPVELEERWQTGELVEGLAFCFNDSVSITHGPHAGAKGRIIALLRIKPEPEYAIELDSGVGEIKAFESKLNRDGT